MSGVSDVRLCCDGYVISCSYIYMMSLDHNKTASRWSFFPYYYREGTIYRVCGLLRLLQNFSRIGFFESRSIVYEYELLFLDKHIVSFFNV